jgi:hypothetical protein
MKAQYLLLATALLAGCSKSPREQVEAAVNRYVRATSHDPGSYEVVSFRMQPYTRNDSVAHAAQAAYKRLLQEDSTATPKLPSSTDTTHIGWLVHLAYRIRNGYTAATNEKGAFIVYPPDVVVPTSE